MKIDHFKAQMDFRLNEVFFKALKEQPLISADTIWEYARREQLMPKEVSIRMAGYFRRFIASSYLKRTGRFVTSTRNDSSALRLYESTICEKESSNANLKAN